jgi:glutathione S-transferase
MLIDAVYATIFRYFNVIEKHSSLSIFSSMPELENWKKKIFERKSVKDAVVHDFDSKLYDFYINRKTYISILLK